MFIPNSVCHVETEITRTLAAFWLEKFDIKNGHKLRIYCVAQDRGRAWPNEMVITIPKWLYERGDMDNVSEYIIHELSHIEQSQKHGRSVRPHGPEFWTIFRRVCPAEWWHYEQNYKPREFKSAGMHLLDVFGKSPLDLTEDDV